MSPPIAHAKSLYRRLVSALIALVVIVSGGVSLFNYLYTARETDTIFENRIMAYSSSLRDSLESPLWNVDDELVHKIGSAFSGNSDIASLTIFDDQQRVIYNQVKPDGNQLKRSIIIEHEGKRIGSVEIGLSLQAYAEKSRGLLLTSLITTLLLIFSFLAALGWLLTRLLKKPFETLISVTNTIVKGGYRQIVPADSYAEFGPILSGLKDMSDAVESRERKLRQINEELAVEIDERAHIEKELRASENKYRSLVRNIQAGIVVHAADSSILISNGAAQTLLGLSEDQMLGKKAIDPAWHFFREDGSVMPVEEYPVNQVIRSRQPLRDLITGVHRSNTENDCWVLVNADPVDDEDGKLAQVVITFVDITARVQAEQQLQRHKEHLEEEVQMRTSALEVANRQLSDTQFAMEKVGIGIHLTDADTGRFFYVNEYAAQLLGYSREELLAMGVPDIDTGFTYDNFKERTLSLRELGSAQIQTTERHRDGHLIPIEVAFYYQPPLPDGPARFISFITDISQRKQAETEIQRARDAAESANRSKSVFLANMSHELRTPLNAILGFSSLMRQDASLTEAQITNLDIINRSGEHLLSLINDILEIAKIEAGKVQLNIVPFDLGALVRDVIDMMALRASAKGLQLLLDQSSEFPRYITGDEARLRQILINLLGNAVKFTEQGGVTLRLGAKLNAIAHLIIEVEDSGRGISAEDQQCLFQPFIQFGKLPSDNKGTGLGLTITRQFVQLMGGSISVTSTVGKGSLFRVDLPLNEVTQADLVPQQKIEKGEVVGLASGQSRYRILIVEDQRENQLLLSQLMQRIGFEVNMAEDGKQGVQLFQSWQPHLIFMDRRMPEMDGIEAAKIIRNLPGGKEVKIVAVTASAFIEQRNEILAAGMDDFVRKPYRFNEIYDSLGRQLGVKYRYAKTQDKAEKSPPAALNAKALAVLPAALLVELRTALESLDSDRIGTVLDQVKPFDAALHQTLSRLADNFDYPAILKVLKANLTEQMP